MANDRQELEDLRRIDELERKASGSTPKESSTWKNIGDLPVPKQISAPKPKKELPTMFNTVPDVGAEAQGYLAAARGLSANVLGLPGSFEDMFNPKRTKAEEFSNIAPSPDNIKELYSRIGWNAPKKEELKAAEFGGDMAVPLVAGGALLKHSLSSGYKWLEPKIMQALGKASKTESSVLLDKLVGEKGLLQKNLDAIKSQEITPQRQSEIDRINAEIAKRDQALSELKKQPEISSRKAEIASPAPTGVAQMKPLREEVQSSRIAPARATAESNLEKATAAETSAGQLKAEADKAIDDLDRKLLATPQIDKNEFGAKLRSILENIRNKYSPIRTREADFEGVFKRNSGTMLDTSDLIKTIYRDKANAASRAERAFLDQIAEGSITPELGNANEALGLKKADSLRKTLDKMIVGYEEKGDKGFAVDRAMAEKAKKYKAMLETKFPEDYKTALKKWAEHSRPLDIIEQRIGSTVSPALEENTISGESKLAEAQVVGAVIRKANDGHQVLSRMLQESPELKDAARLYFTQDLFGAKIAPTEKELARWIEANGNALDQLGLRHEFQTMRDAKATAQEALDVAKGRFNQAVHDRKMAEQVKSEMDKKATMQSKRIAEAEKAAPNTGKILSEKESRAEEARKRLTGEKRKMQSDIEKINEQESARMTSEIKSQNEAIERLSKIRMDTTRGTNPKEVVANAEGVARYLLDNHHIQPQQYEEIMTAARQLSGTIEQQTAARKKLAAIAVGLAAAAGMNYPQRKAFGL